MYNEWGLEVTPKTINKKFRIFKHHILSDMKSMIKDYTCVRIYNNDSLTMIFYYNLALRCYTLYIKVDKDCSKGNLLSKVDNLIKLFSDEIFKIKIEFNFEGVGQEFYLNKMLTHYAFFRQKSLCTLTFNISGCGPKITNRYMWKIWEPYKVVYLPNVHGYKSC